MDATSIENKPKTYTRPTLIGNNFTSIVVSELPADPPSEDESELIIEYKFNNTLNNSYSGYNLTPVGSIQYNTSPNSVELNGSSYLSVDIDFEVKTLSFWFNLPDVNIDNYLLSFDNDFYIKANANSLEFQSCNITRDFSSNIWYNLALTSNNANYDIYLDNTKLPETILYKDLSSSTLNIGKYDKIEIEHSGIRNFTGYNVRNHSMVAIGDHMYVFGGITDTGDVLNDLYKIDTAGNFIKINLSGATPPVRHYHSMVAIDSNIYIFGGFSSDFVPNDLYKIDTLLGSCETINLSGVIPSARYGHSMVVIGDDIYIFGGYASSGEVNDLYKIDTFGNCEQINVGRDDGDNIPARRYGHSMVVIDNHMYVFGGMSSPNEDEIGDDEEDDDDDDDVLTDLYKIDINGISEKITLHGDDDNIPPVRYYHSMVVIGSNMYIFGGDDGDDGDDGDSAANLVPNDLYEIDTDGNSTKITLNEETVTKRRKHTMVILGSNMYIFGGSDGSFLDDLIKIPFTFKSHYLNGKIADLRLYNTIYNQNYYVTTFIYTSDSPELNGQTQYDITFTKDTMCYILIVGGGGGGYGSAEKYHYGGGGGGGAILYATGLQVTSGIYTVKVGRGGVGELNDGTSAEDGFSSEAFGAIANGGSKGKRTLDLVNWYGGEGGTTNISSSSFVFTEYTGGNGGTGTYNLDTTVHSLNGDNGRLINIVGPYYWGGGGGGGGMYAIFGSGGEGGGGGGGFYSNGNHGPATGGSGINNGGTNYGGTSPNNAVPGSDGGALTGGGGGGSFYNNGGSGGSGVVIIKTSNPITYEPSHTT
jgi:hypothetical protein